MERLARRRPADGQRLVAFVSLLQQASTLYHRRCPVTVLKVRVRTRCPQMPGLIFAGEPAGELQRFGEWALSGQGQLGVEAVELWPLGPADREQGKTLLAAR